MCKAVTLCVIAILQVVVSIPLGKEVEFTCPSSDGNYPVPGQCTGDFYTCVGGVAYAEKCPADAIFDPELLLCVSPNSASCRMTTMNILTTEKFTCTSDGNFPVVGQECTSNYIVCVDGISYPAVCPGTTVFDPVTRLCSSFNSSSCAAATTAPSTSTPTASTTPSTTPTIDSTITSPTPTTTPISTFPTCNKFTCIDTTTSTTVMPSNFTCPQDEGFFTIPGQCSSDYFACIGGIAYPQQCPGGAIFDEFSSSCVSEQSAYCKRSTTTTPTTTTTPSTTTSTTTTPSTTTETTTTPSPTPTGSTASTTSGPFRCPFPTGDYANPSDCKTYYRCFNSVPTLMSCPNGLVFNPVIAQCDWPYNVPGCDGLGFRW